MLSDSDRELLTAFLDGQLGARERTAALRLLQRSSEARQMLLQFQEDSHALRELPRQSLPTDFSTRVLRVAAERGLRPGTARPPVRPRLPAWARLAVAAALLLAVGGGALLVLGGQDTPEGVAVGIPTVPLPPKDAPPPETGLRLALRDLDQEAARTRLTKELHPGSSYHLALDSGDTSRTVKQLEAAFRATGIQLLVDPRAGASLARREPGKRYVVYAENVRPVELAAMLRRLGREEGLVRRNDLDHDSVLVNPMSAQDNTDLAHLLGIPEDRLRLPKLVPLSEPPIHVPGKPKGKETADNGQAAKQPPRLAVVLPDEAGNPAASAALRRFLASRRHHYASTLQVYLVVHDASR
jgi:hypothetical protein